MQTTNNLSEVKNLNGYIHLFTTATIFEMDLVGKNLQMNGIDALWFYPDMVDDPRESSTLFVPAEQSESALSILAALDLTDFTLHNGK